MRELRWTDLLLDEEGRGFIFVQRDGSGPTTKDRDPRRVPIHPELRTILDALPHSYDRVFTRKSRYFPEGGGPICERRLLASLKCLCRGYGFANPKQYKLHTFRHAFASMCARNNVSYKYALEWMGHSSSEILDLYYTMFDDTAQTAIRTIRYEQKPLTK